MVTHVFGVCLFLLLGVGKSNQDGSKWEVKYAMTSMGSFSLITKLYTCIIKKDTYFLVSVEILRVKLCSFVKYSLF